MKLEPITLAGTVVTGEGIASRDYDVPTANLKFSQEPDIETGVYAGFADYDGDRYRCVIAYGVGEPPKFEVHLFGFDGELLGEHVSVELMHKVSELIPWQSKERMRQKIFHDIELVHAFLDQVEE